METFDVVVVGAGPGGEVGAIRAAQLGMKVALVEKNEHLGGTCLNVGCIPTKALLHSAKTWDRLQQASEAGFSTGDIAFDWAKIMARKDKIVDQQRKGLKFLMKKNKITCFHGTGKISARDTLQVSLADGTSTSLKTKHILLATGSRVRELSFAKSNDKNILTSDTILFIDHVPDSLAVIGGGVVGMEFASLFARMGSKVTVIELMDQILPFEDPEAVKEASRSFKKQGITIKTGTKLSSLSDDGKSVTVETEGGEPLKVDKVLLSIGRAPVTEGIGLETVGIKPETSGAIPVNDHYQTSCPSIYAIGDIIPTPMLAHTASAEALHAVEHMAGHHPPVINYEANPSAVYTYPELASIGKREQDLDKEGIPYEVAKFPFAPMAKAKIEDATIGFIKILFGSKYRELLGVHIIGASATEMIAEFSLGMNLETTVDEIGLTIHPHPTISETIMETAHAAVGGAIHM